MKNRLCSVKIVGMIFMLAFLQQVNAQERYVQSNTQCLYGESDASINPKGVHGYILIQNTCDHDLYFKPTYAKVEVLKEVIDKKTGKSSKSWNSTSLGYASGIFLKAGFKLRKDNSANDNGLMSGLFGQESYFTDLRKPNLTLGESLELNYEKPNAKCFKIELNGTTPLFELDGLAFTYEMARHEDNGYWNYTGTLFIKNNSPDKVKFSDKIHYKIYFSGIQWEEMEHYGNIKSGHTKSHIHNSAAFTITPSVYLEFTDLPALEGMGAGNQVERIPVPQ